MVRYEKVLSGDSHMREPYDLWWRTIGNRLGERCPRVIHEYKGLKGEFFFSGGRVAKVIRTNVKGLDPATADLFTRAGYDPAVRVQFQDQAGVAAEVLFPSVFAPIQQCGVGDVAAAAAEVYNDWLTEFVSHAPSRFIGLAPIPTYDRDFAVKEIRRAKQKGLRGAIVNTVQPEGVPPYRDRYWDPLWATAQDIDMPIVLHIVTGRVIDPIVYAITPDEMEVAAEGIFDMWNEIQKAIATEFVFGAILDRFERLKVIDAEYEISWIPYFMFRLDQSQSQFTDYLTMPKLKHRASDYMKGRIWHGMTDDPLAVDTIRQVGASQVMWGSDFPHVRSIGLDTQRRLNEMFGALTPAEQKQVVGENVVRVFGPH